MLDSAPSAGVTRRFLRWRLLLVGAGSLLVIAIAPAAAAALPPWVQWLWGTWVVAALAQHLAAARLATIPRDRLQFLVALLDAPVIAALTGTAGIGGSVAAPLLAISVAATAGRIGTRRGVTLLLASEAALACAWLPSLEAAGRTGWASMALQAGALAMLALFQGIATRVARASRGRWERLFDAVPDMIFVLDRNAEVVLANRAAERVTGYDQATLRGGRLARFVAPGQREAAMAQMNRTLNGESMAYEAAAYRADGTPLPVRMSTVPLLEDGEITGVLAVAHDLTEQQRAARERERMAQALEANRRFLEGIVRSQASVLYLLDLRERRATFMNDAMQELLGLDVERLASLPSSERRARIHPDDRDAVRRALAHARTLDDDARVELEYRVRDSHGRWRWLADRIGVFERDTTGRPVVLVGSGIDITERKLSVEALRRSEQRYRTLLEHFPGGSVILFDDQLRITLADGQALRAIGLAPGDLAGQEVGALLDPAAAARARVFAAAALGGEEQQYELQDGERVHEMRVVPIRDPDGTVRGGMSLSTDVTERRRLEDERRQRMKMEAVGTLAGGIAHDFNNILASIMGYSELVLMEATDARVREDVQEVLVAAGRGRQLVQRILAFSRSGRQERQPVALGPIVEEAVRLLRPTLPRGVEVRVEVDPALPTVLGDPLELHQVVVNLCGNAVHAMRDGGGTLDVAVHRTGASSTAPVRLVVRDTGTGMPRDVRERAFDPFFTTKPPGEGSGMGLAMVHGIVSALEGTITLQSEPGHGTTMTVELPADGTAAPALDASPEPPAPRGGTERILVVDDEPTVARFLAQALERLGYAVEVLHDPEVAAVRLGGPDAGADLVVCDMTMPRLSGEQLLAIAHAAHPTLPVLLCTGFSASMSPDRAQALGAVALLPKPVTVEMLGRAVREALDGRAVRAP
jgi:PAS domain S-box-containing protein